MELTCRLNIARSLGYSDAVLTSYEDAVAAVNLAETLEEPHLIATAHYEATSAALSLGRLDDAKSHSEKGTAVALRTGIPVDVLNHQIEAARISYAAGGLSKAAELASMRIDDDDARRPGLLEAAAVFEAPAVAAAVNAPADLALPQQRELARVWQGRALQAVHADYLPRRSCGS